MRNSNYLLCVAVVLCSLILLGASCRNNDGVNNQPGNDVHSDSIANFFAATIQYRSWKINSETISPAVNGSAEYPIDKCNKDVTYIFSKFFSTSISHEGEMTVDFHNTDCGSGKRVNPELASFYIDINPNRLEFADDGNNAKSTRYIILKSTTDSLVLQTTIGTSKLTKVYLTDK